MVDDPIDLFLAERISALIVIQRGGIVEPAICAGNDRIKIRYAEDAALDDGICRDDIRTKREMLLEVFPKIGEDIRVEDTVLP